VLQCGAAWCTVVQWGASVVQYGAVCCRVVQCVVAWCNVSQSGAVWCSVAQCVAMCCSVLQCVAVCCSVLQRVAVWCNDGHDGNTRTTYDSFVYAKWIIQTRNAHTEFNIETTSDRQHSGISSQFYTYMYTYIDTYIDMYVYIRIYIYVYIYSYIYLYILKSKWPPIDMIRVWALNICTYMYPRQFHLKWKLS